jgi:predicted MFS family arabinose efflux permease
MSAFFAGGAVGSTLGGLAFALGGWSLASWIGFALPMLALAFFAITWMRSRLIRNANA